MPKGRKVEASLCLHGLRSMQTLVRGLRRTGHFLGRKSSCRLKSISSLQHSPLLSSFGVFARDCFQPYLYPPYDSGLEASNLMHTITLLQGLLEPPMSLFLHDSASSDELPQRE